MCVKKPEGRSLRSIPSVDSVLRHPGLQPLLARHGHSLVTEAVREVVERIRAQARDGGAAPDDTVEQPEIVTAVEAALRRSTSSSLRRVINATGVVVHTNLGRARLSDEALARVALAGGCPVSLEYDVATGERGSRTSHLARPLALLFPDHGALAVNNNAAAVLLALNTLAEGKEVVLSRGELVEIGGSFRIPDIMAKSGARLKEVGTTNRTRLSDYAGAIGPSTGLVLKVHTSNYRIVGFTEETGVAELSALARERGIPLMVDQGSGCLRSLSAAGVRDEPTVAAILEQGADLVTFSGDKLLGGPQAGIAVGRRDLIAAMSRNPLHRALRLDKMTIAALEATLDAWARGAEAIEVPGMRMILASRETLRERAEHLRAALEGPLGDAARVDVIEGESRVGGGAAPMEALPTALVRIRPLAAHGTPGLWAERLRAHSIPVIAMVRDEALLLDPRSIEPYEETTVVEALRAAARPTEAKLPVNPHTR